MSVAEYHDHPNRYNVLTHKVDFTKNDLLGLEIETHTKSNFDVNTVAKMACASGNILAERDSSLDRNAGVEYIFRPISYSELTDDCYIANWAKYMRDKCKTWSMPYHGMHISINITNLSYLKIGKFCHFINSNKRFCDSISGRNYGADFFIRPISFNANDYRLCTPRSYAATKRSATRVEVRIFQASTNWERIKQNCQFVDSVRCFTGEVSLDKLTVDEFKEWLSGHEKKYPRLSSRILRKVCV